MTYCLPLHIILHPLLSLLVASGLQTGLSSCFIHNRFSKWDHLVTGEERNEMTRRYKLVVGDKKRCPLDYVSSFASYVYSPIYKERLDHNTSIVLDHLDCKGRTARSYAFAMTFVNLIFDEFPLELQSKGISLVDFEL
jgi:hypothetical protein